MAQTEGLFSGSREMSAGAFCDLCGQVHMVLLQVKMGEFPVLVCGGCIADMRRLRTRPRVKEKTKSLRRRRKGDPLPGQLTLDRSKT